MLHMKQLAKDILIVPQNHFINKKYDKALRKKYFQILITSYGVLNNVFGKKVSQIFS